MHTFELSCLNSDLLLNVKLSFKKRERKNEFSLQMGCCKKCFLLYLSRQFFCHFCCNSVKDNYLKCNEMSALMWTLPNMRSITPQQAVMPEPSAIAALSGNCPQIFETFLELTNKCWLAWLVAAWYPWLALPYNGWHCYAAAIFLLFFLNFPVPARGRLIHFN